MWANMPEVTQLVRAGAKIGSQVVWLFSLDS